MKAAGKDGRTRGRCEGRGARNTQETQNAKDAGSREAQGTRRMREEGGASDACEEEAARRRLALADELAFCECGASLLMEPIEVPGTSFVTHAHAYAELMLEMLEREGEGEADGDGSADKDSTASQRTDSAASERAGSLRAWLAEVSRLAEDGDEEALAEQQRLLGVDRTALCRGVRPEGPLPPYEAYYATTAHAGGAGGTGAGEAAGAAPSSVARAYREADVHLGEDIAEREDYLGVELAFLAHLSRKEAEARDREDEGGAARAQAQREAFERDHVLAWAAHYAEVALPHARTALFAAFLEALAAFARA